MINKNYIILSLLAALLLVLFFFTCNKQKQPTKYIPVVSIVEKKIKADSIDNKKQVDSLRAIEDKLRKKVNEQKTDLKAAQELVTELLNEPLIFGDTATLLAQVEFLKKANETKDSICNSTISTQDSIISQKENQYQAALDFQAKQRQSIDELLLSNKAADTEIKSLSKQIKKQKANKVLYKIIAGVAIVYGVSKSL